MKQVNLKALLLALGCCVLSGFLGVTSSEAEDQVEYHTNHRTGRINLIRDKSVELPRANANPAFVPKTESTEVLMASPISGDEEVSEALEFVERHAGMLGKRGSDELLPHLKKSDWTDMTHVHLKQMYNVKYSVALFQPKVVTSMRRVIA